MTPLYAELHHWQITEHEWGYFDCFLAPCHWVAWQRGFDPAAEVRGTYGNPDRCPVGRDLLTHAEIHARRALAPLQTVGEAIPGDVALLRLPRHRFLCGALKLDGRNWAMKTKERSVIVTRVGTPVVIWRVQQ